MIRVGILGATGYTALELIRLLLRHPEVQITRVTSRDETRPHLSQVHPSLAGQLDLHVGPFEINEFSADVDFAFSCLPHAASASAVAQLVNAGIRVVDFSADYRLSSSDLFESIYNTTHPDPDRVASVPYGIPELFRDQIRDANLVANPGCFPSSVLIPLAPVLKAGLVDPDTMIADSKTGISGAGRKANLKFHYPECNESVSAYAVGTHRHMPEIDDLLQRYTGRPAEIVFTPHLIPMDRGILSTIYLRPATGDAQQTAEKILKTLHDTYADEPFIRIPEDTPRTKSVAHSNYCDIHVTTARNLVVVLCALDNMVKGASGAAVQNFNLMNGLPETTAL